MKKSYYLKKDASRELIKIKKDELKIYEENIENKKEDRMSRLKVELEFSKS